jgi:hypothetical protein
VAGSPAGSSDLSRAARAPWAGNADADPRSDSPRRRPRSAQGAPRTQYVRGWLADCLGVVRLTASSLLAPRAPSRCRCHHRGLPTALLVLRDIFGALYTLAIQVGQRFCRLPGSNR